MFDLIIQHARLCDGTGNPSFVGTLGVTDGHITYLGRDTGLVAQRTIHADGLVLAPGFIDPHTHYDAQIAWDPLLTSSPWHGVTTVVMGSCSVGRVWAGLLTPGPARDLHGREDRRHLCGGDPGVRAGYAYGGVPRSRVAQQRVAARQATPSRGEP